MTGGDMGESISDALAARRSFSDIFREQGTDPQVAGVLGLGADFLSDPLNLIPGVALVKALKGAKAVAGMALDTGVVRSLATILKETPPMPARTATAELRASAARGAFRQTVPGGVDFSSLPDPVQKRALADARAAAHKAGEPLAPDNLVVQGAFAMSMLSRLGRAASGGRFGKLLKDAQEARRMYVSNLATSLRKDKAAFGDQGEEIADLLIHSERVADKLEGERTAFYWRMIRPLLHTVEERINFTQLSGGEAVKALNPRVEEAVQRFRDFDTNTVFKDASEGGLRELVPKTHALGQQELFPEVAARAREIARGDPTEWLSVPIQHRQNHVPRFYNKDATAKLGKAGPEQSAAITNLVENGMAQNKDDAMRILDEMLHADDGYFTPLEFRGGPLQFSRELLLNVPWEKDPDKWFPRYMHVTSRRLAQMGVFGPQDEKLLSWLKNVQESGGDINRATNIYRLAIGRPTRELSRFHSAASAIGAGQTMMWLGPKTAMLQFMQLANSIGAFGFSNTFRGLAATLFDPDTRQLAREVGAMLPSTNMAWEGDIGTSWSSWYLHTITKMPAADRAVRTTSGSAGMLAAKQWAEAMPGLSGRGLETAERNLRRLGIDPAAVQEGQLTVGQLRSSFLAGSNLTQFASHLTDMPETWKTPIGRFMFKFRPFSKQQSRFVGILVDEAFTHKNPAPLMRYLAAYPVIYNAARPSLNFLAGRHAPEDEESAKDYLKGLLYTGTLGGLGDFFTNVTANDPERVMGMATGPALSQAAGILSALGGVTEGDTSRLRRVIQPAITRPLNIFEGR
jgi:hypothetical protein